MAQEKRNRTPHPLAHSYANEMTKKNAEELLKYGTTNKEWIFWVLDQENGKKIWGMGSLGST